MHVINDKELVYLVNPLPQSLLNFVFYFGILSEDDEKNYIYNIIDILFDKEEEDLHKDTTKVIFNSHKYLRELSDSSDLSLREISKFSKLFVFFKEYLYNKRKFEENKNIEDEKIINKQSSKINDYNSKEIEKFDKIRSIIYSIYLCYYIRLENEYRRKELNNQLTESLISLINNSFKAEKKETIIQKNIKDYNEDNEEKDNNLSSKIKNRTLKNFINENRILYFSDFLSLEEDYLIDKIELKKGIGKNDLLKEIVFLLFVSIATKIPLIIVGKPGIGKSLGFQLIYNSMRGKYSKNKFFKQFPQIVLTYFQGTESTKPEDIEKLFEIAENKLDFYKNKEEFKNEKIPISLILIEELGIADKSKSNPLTVLHSKLEYNGNEKGVSFIGFSNYILDDDKINRALNLNLPNLEDKIDRLIFTTRGIVKMISEDLSSHIIFKILTRAYYVYKKLLNFIKEFRALKQYNIIKRRINIKENLFREIKNKKEFKQLIKNEKKVKSDFHSNRDLYNYIREIAIKVEELSNIDETELKNIINSRIERNFGGIDYEFDIDFNLKLPDIEKSVEYLREILKEKIPEKKKTNRNERNQKEKKEIIKASSVFLFKKIYNKVCEEEKEKKYQLDIKEFLEYDLNKNINDNIADNDSRYLLLEIKSSMVSLIYKNLKFQNSEKGIVFIDGSSFQDDNNNEYKSTKIREIQENISTDNMVILKNLNQIHPFLYDLYNKNYIIIDDKKYVRICLDNFNIQLVPINEIFKIIIMVDQKFVNNLDYAFLDRLEKIKISFENLLDEEQKSFAKNILNDIDFERYIDSHKINYELKDLLINCGREEIQGLIYYETKKMNSRLDKKIIEEIVYNKIVKILSQDIISILPDGHKIKELYLNEKKYYNLKTYINDLKEEKYKISIIYTFNSIASSIKGINNEMSIAISEIKREEQLKRMIKEIQYKNEKFTDINDLKINFIYINFEQYNSDKIQYISEYIKKNCKKDNYKYIFIIHIQRNFINQANIRIYSMPDIDPEIDQIFIDNLNGENIKLKDLLKSNIKDILNSNDIYMDLNNEFNKVLANFIYKQLNLKRCQINDSSINRNGIRKISHLDFSLKQKDKNYINEIQEYMNDNNSFKENIIKKSKHFIFEDNYIEKTILKLIDKIMLINYIDKNSLDIISCILNYIKEEMFGKYLKYIFNALEDNNILTTLTEIKNSKNISINEKLINQIIEYSLERIIYDENKIYNPKFLYGYRIPGFFNYYKYLSDYICNNAVIIDYYNLEKNLRKYQSRANSDKKLKQFYQKENESLSSIYDYISNNDEFFFKYIEKINSTIILKDYISYYLEKYDLKNEINNNLIELILNIRYKSEKNQNIKENTEELIKILLLKIVWIETNTNYILSILNVYSNAEKIFNSKDKLFEMVKKLMSDRSIKYIYNETRNPIYTKVVNECFYIILASLCLSITDEEIVLTEKIETKNNNLINIDYYLEILKKINLILQDLNDNLNLSLNEMYIIDELISIIELQKLKKININSIIYFRKLLRENSAIIQKDKADKFSELIVNFQKIYDKLVDDKISEIKTNEDIIYNNKYYDTLKYIYLKEIKKIINKNYRLKIFEKVIQDKEIIKRSNDIFQILLKKIIKTGKEEKDGFKNNLDELRKGDEVVKLIENNLLDSSEDNYFSLQETILSLFEKNSLIYLKNILYSEEKEGENIYIDEGTPFYILDDCINFLVKYNFYNISDQIKHLRKLLCIAYIKVYCYIFVKMIGNNSPKLKDPLSIVDLLENKRSKTIRYSMNEIIKLYIYRIIYNQNNKQLDVFLHENKKKEYKLDKYKGFKDFFKFEEEGNINFGFLSLDNDYDIFYDKIEFYKKDGFKKKIIKSDIIDESEFFIDNFFNASYILILSKLKISGFETSQIYENYYNNICVPLFEGEKRLSIIIEFLFNPRKYEELKKYGINSSNIEAILYGYRYCLNCIGEIKNDNENENYVFSTLYDKNKISYLSEKCYPGSNPLEYYELSNKIINHFNEKPNEGCYICLCEKGFYHSIPSGFPGCNEINLKCPKCSQPIGSIYIQGEKGKVCKIINRGRYMRIFKDINEIEEIKRNPDGNRKLNEINFMTIEEFEKGLKGLYKEDKGLHRISESYFIKEDKKIRNLSQISYRLLNYILYSHLFFAKLFTGLSEYFDKYLPKGMNWGETLYECWILLKKELSKKNINSIDIFMNFAFKEVYYKMHRQECVDDYDGLIEFEDKLEELIQKKIKSSLEECEKYQETIKKMSKDKNSFLSLLTEKFDKYNYDKEQYPNYDNFYYTDYLDEENISKLLNFDNQINRNNYLILNKYLVYIENKKMSEYKKKKEDNDYYSLDNLYIVINTINLFNDNYSHIISREDAETKILEDEDIYHSNMRLINKFIKIYNKIIENENNEKKKYINKQEDTTNKDRKNNSKNNEKFFIKLSIKNPISDFFLDSKTEYGKIYKKILQKFIERQNKELSALLNKKISEGKIDTNNLNKINIQQMKDNEIFTFNSIDKFSFICEAYNSSYRKIIDNKNYEMYNHYEINFELFEDNMTNLLLKNKKLLKDDIIEFNYNNEIFTNYISNAITSYKEKYKNEQISVTDKVIIYKFKNTINGNKDLYKIIIDDFITLIKYLSERKEENIMISEINLKIENKISPEFKKIFEDNENLTINKTLELLKCFLNLIFNDIKKETGEFNLDFKDKKAKEYFQKDLNKFFEKEKNNGNKEKDNKKIINKKNLSSAIKLFISIILFKIKDKENKIKKNNKNIINYLNEEYLWNKEIFQNKKFNEDIIKLKSFNIKINRIIWFFDYLVEDEKDDNYLIEIEDYIKKNEIQLSK